jgi:hypothetical protein
MCKISPAGHICPDKNLTLSEEELQLEKNTKMLVKVWYTWIRRMKKTFEDTGQGLPCRKPFSTPIEALQKSNGPL